MQFTGRNLEFIHEALEWAEEGLQGRIGSCPDVVMYANELDELEADLERCRRLKARVGKALGYEPESDE